MLAARKTLVRSALVSVFMTLEGMVLQMAKSRLVLHAGPPPLGHLVGVTACYLVAAFTYALGFFLVAKRLPGRTSIAKGLRYAIVVLLAVWISGFINLFAIDFAGGWNLLSPAKVEAYWMGVADCVNFVIGGLLLGFIARRDALPPVTASFTARLLARIAVGAVLLPALWAGFFHLATLVLPSGHDLSGERATLFYVFLFAPLAISGAGTALFHDDLRPRSGRGVLAESYEVFRFIFALYWVPNVSFVLFLGFTWRDVVDFLVSGAAALCLTIMTLERMATAAREPAHGGPRYGSIAVPSPLSRSARR